MRQLTESEKWGMGWVSKWLALLFWEKKVRGSCCLSDGPLVTCDTLGCFKPNLRRGSVSSNPNLSIKFWKNPGRWETDRGFLYDLSGQLSALCWFWQPPSWPGGRHLLADQLSNVYFHPSPSTCCLLPQWQDRKGQQGHEGEMSVVTGKPGRCEGNWWYCKAKCYRDMEDTMKGLRGHVVNLWYWKQRGVIWGGRGKPWDIELQEIKVQ